MTEVVEVVRTGGRTKKINFRGKCVWAGRSEHNKTLTRAKPFYSPGHVLMHGHVHTNVHALLLSQAPVCLRGRFLLFYISLISSFSSHPTKSCRLNVWILCDLQSRGSWKIAAVQRHVQRRRMVPPPQRIWQHCYLNWYFGRQAGCYCHTRGSEQLSPVFK